MGIRVILIIILCSFFSSCSSKRNDVLTEEEYYLLSFKSAVFYGCLNTTTDKDFHEFLVSKNDLGSYIDVEVLLHATYSQAGDLGKKHAQSIKPVSLPDADNKLPGYTNCFRYAMSREIDSVARAEYKKFKS